MVNLYVWTDIEGSKFFTLAMSVEQARENLLGRYKEPSKMFKRMLLAEPTVYYDGDTFVIYDTCSL